MSSRFLSAALLGAAALLPGCANKPVTTVDMTWASPQLPQAPTYKKLLIITVAGDELVQIALQDQMAAALQKRGVNAIASKRYFSRYTDAEKARFRKSIEESDADYVLLARVTRTEQGARQDQLMTFGDATGLYSTYDRHLSVARSSADNVSKTVTAEASIFAISGEKLIWSVRTRTAHASVTTGENFAPQYIDVILDAMKKDKLL